MAEGPQDIVKSYPARGPMQQYRLGSLTAFRCFRCGQEKKSKLLTVFRDDWSNLLCNGCYGFLLSVFKIKAGEVPTTERAHQLGELLLTLVSETRAREIGELLAGGEPRLLKLTPLGQRFLTSAEFVAGHLRQATELDWSSAVIGLCKSCEVELNERLIEPLANAVADLDLTDDCADKDFGRIARYCAGRTATRPEIGAIRHFLQTAANSRSRRETSPLLRTFFDLMADWPESSWLLRDDGALGSLSALAQDFRNPAAHTERLDEDDYAAARKLVLEAEGIIWRILSSTSS